VVDGSVPIARGGRSACGSGALEDWLVLVSLTIPVGRNVHGPSRCRSRSRCRRRMVVRLVDEPVLFETSFGFVHEVTHFFLRHRDQRDDRNSNRNEHERDGDDDQ
jgi:hypothetical protein